MIRESGWLTHSGAPIGINGSKFPLELAALHQVGMGVALNAADQLGREDGLGGHLAKYPQNTHLMPWLFSPVVELPVEDPDEEGRFITDNRELMHRQLDKLTLIELKRLADGRIEYLNIVDENRKLLKERKKELARVSTKPACIDFIIELRSLVVAEA